MSHRVESIIGTTSATDMLLLSARSVSLSKSSHISVFFPVVDVFSVVAVVVVVVVVGDGDGDGGGVFVVVRIGDGVAVIHVAAVETDSSSSRRVEVDSDTNSSLVLPTSLFSSTD